MKTNQFMKHWVAGISAALLLAACGGEKPKDAPKAADAGAAPAAAAPAAGGVEVTISCGSVGQDHDVCQKNVAEWEKKTGNKVKLYSDPKDSSEKLALFRQQFGAEIDTFLKHVCQCPGNCSGIGVQSVFHGTQASASAAYQAHLERFCVRQGLFCVQAGHDGKESGCSCGGFQKTASVPNRVTHLRGIIR